MRWSQNPFPKKSKEEDRQWVQAQKAKRGMRDLFPNASPYVSHLGESFVILAPILLIFSVIIAIPIYVVWFIRQLHGYPDSRRTFLRQELARLSWTSVVALVPYSVIDALFFKNHVYLSLLGIPLGIWMSWKMKKKFRVAAKTRKWETRRRRKLKKQEVREQKEVA